MLHAFGSAGTITGGLWEFLRDAADSKQLHTGHAASAGLQAAYLAQSGFTGAQRILEGKQGLGVAMTEQADPARLVDRLGQRWALAETSFKFHASCRHTHPAADALQKAMQDHRLSLSDIESVVTHVHQGAIDVLGPVTDPQTVHQSKFSMGTVLGLIAAHNSADLVSFDAALQDKLVREFRDRVTMQLDPEVDNAYPQQWIGKVTVTTHDGKTFTSVVQEPKGDPGNTLSRAEIEDKLKRLGTYQGAATDAELDDLAAKIWQLEKAQSIGPVMSF
jgi:2-methylcitrate dehydratase PrpD